MSVDNWQRELRSHGLLWHRPGLTGIQPCSGRQSRFIIMVRMIDNKMLLRIGDSRCSLQAQLPWLFMIPIFFGILNWQYRWRTLIINR